MDGARLGLLLGAREIASTPAARRLGEMLSATTGAVGRFVKGGPAPMEPDLVQTQMGAVLSPGMTRRPNVLPWTYDAETGQAQLAMPRVLDAMLAGVPSSVAGAVPGAGVSRGGAVLGAGTTKSLGLPMDQASRMARAEEMGFMVDMPLYHGTSREFDRFSLNPPERTAPGPLSEQGVWTSRSPEYASDFAYLAAEGSGLPQVVPLYHRTRNPHRVDATGASRTEIAGEIQNAWERGHDAVMVDNYTMGPFSKVDPTTHVVVRDPSQLRSPFAAFDPAKWSSPDLLAGRAPVAPPAAPTLYPDGRGGLVDDQGRPFA